MKNLNNKINDKLLLSKQKLTEISKQKLNEIPFRKIAPNMVTMMALCSGVTSIRFAIAENWTKAVLCIFLAALFDGLDGRVARFLKASSKFGAELDSLSDFVSFGVAPAILIYQWSLVDLPKFGWLFCLMFAMVWPCDLRALTPCLIWTMCPNIGRIILSAFRHRLPQHSE